MALSARGVDAEKRPGLHGDGRGLYLRVGPSGSAKSWILRFQLNGKRRDAGLGSVEFVTLAEARDKAYQLRKALRLGGVDPIEEKRASKRLIEATAAQQITFAELAEAYIRKFSPSWKSARHAAQWRSTLDAYVLPVFGEQLIGAIDTARVLAVLNPLWLDKTETASRVRGRIETVLDYARSAGHRSGENPARWRGHLENLLPRPHKVAKVAHYAALPYDQIAGLMTELRGHPVTASSAIQFCILTACRTGEAIGARWSEIDLERRLWVVPAQRMKAGKEHRVPLSEPALRLLEHLAEHRRGDYVFPGRTPGKGISDRTMLALLERMGKADITVHGFRATFKTWATESTNFPSELAELALAHTVGSAVERAYLRSDQFEKRRQLSEAWANYCDSTSTGTIRHLRSPAA